MVFFKRFLLVNFLAGLFLLSCEQGNKKTSSVCHDEDHVAIQTRAKVILDEMSLVKIKELCSDFFKKNPQGCLVKDQNGQLLPTTSYDENFEARCLKPHCQDITEAEHIEKLKEIVAETDKDKRSALCQDFRKRNPLFCLYEIKDASGNIVIGPSGVPTDWDKFCDTK